MEAEEKEERPNVRYFITTKEDGLAHSATSNI